MKSLVFVLLLLVPIFATAESTVEIFLPPGDLNGLRQAMDDAAAGDPNVKTIIETVGTFKFSAGVGLPEVRTHIVIRGSTDRIRFMAGNDNPSSELVLVRKKGWLELQNVEIKRFPLGVDQLGTNHSLIVNHGILELTQVQIDSLEGNSSCSPGICIQVSPIIKNTASGQLYLDQVSLIDSGTGLDGGIIFNDGTVDIQNTQLYYSSEKFWAAPFRNNRTMSLKNISMFQSNNHRFFPNTPIATVPGAETQVSNSVISGFSGAWCDAAISLGHNLIDHDQCDFKAEGDVIGEPAGLIWRPVVTRCCSQWAVSFLTPILTHALVPLATSLAVDSVEPELCPLSDLLRFGSIPGQRILDGNGDGVAKCDKGAVELRPTFLAEGGINGIYYNPDADGHYLYILDNDFNTVVMWNSFDKDGNQSWVFGTGELITGNSLFIDAFTNVNGSISPDGEILPADAVKWGTLEIEMSSCNEGVLVFNSDLPKFGSGQVRLVRLASVKQLGCVD